jgi:arabinose-5-phosphate isomerase
MTGNASSSLAALSDVHIEIPCGREACPFGMAPTTSATATMVMGDALAMALLEAQKFDISEYALNHPAGAIGRALVMKAADVMRTGERLAVVSSDATVMATLLAMTKAQSGSAVVADSDGKLLGIFTDGDFRRLMSDGAKKADGVLEAPVSAVMTASPQFVHDDAYAAELLKVFERRRIDDLPVCDRSGRVVGLVDIQDLPKVKVM